MSDEEKAGRPGGQSPSPPQTYLRRRIEHLVRMAEERRLHFVEETLGRQKTDEIIADLLKVQRDEHGRIELATCSPIVRTLARTVYNLLKMDGPQPPSEQQPDPADEGLDLVETQRELFAHFESYTVELCGCQPSRFSSVDDFHEAIKKRLSSKKVDGARLDSILTDLQKTYVKHSRASFAGGKRLGGLKLVLGGTSRLPSAAVDAVRSMLLYADTILIPDPVFPWLESERTEEQFPFVWMVRQMYSVLQLKPLIDSELPYPAVVVFPSWERSLELSDEDTQDSISRLALDFFSHHLGAWFEDESEIVDFATARESDFLREVEDKGLFIPPGGRAGMPITEAIDLYREDISKYRSKELGERMQELPAGVLVFNGIMERLAPQFHLRDNADMLRAEPMLWHETFWHYFGLCSSVSEGRLVTDGALQSDSLAVVRALNDREFRWLGNVPMGALVELRERNENEEFRRRLGEFTATLGDAAVKDLARVVAEVGRGLASLLTDHQNEIRRIEERYRRRHTGTAVGLGVTLAAQFLPWLVPHLGALSAVAPGKYAFDKIAEVQEKSSTSRTLTGVLAAAHSKN